MVLPLLLPAETFNGVKAFFSAVNQQKKIDNYFLTYEALPMSQTIKDQVAIDFLNAVFAKAKGPELQVAWNKIRNNEFNEDRQAASESYLKALEVYLSVEPELAKLAPEKLRTQENARLVAGRYPSLAQSLS